jgi:hypothetical protein
LFPNDDDDDDDDDDEEKRTDADTSLGLYDVTVIVLPVSTSDPPEYAAVELNEVAVLGVPMINELV